MSFKNSECNVNELYKTNKILKIAVYIKLLNRLFVRDTNNSTINNPTIARVFYSSERHTPT